MNAERPGRDLRFFSFRGSYRGPNIDAGDDQSRQLSVLALQSATGNDCNVIKYFPSHSGTSPVIRFSLILARSGSTNQYFNRGRIRENRMTGEVRTNDWGSS